MRPDARPFTSDAVGLSASLTAFTDSLDEGVLICDVQRRILYANPVLLAWLESAAEKLHHRRFNDLFGVSGSTLRGQLFIRALEGEVISESLQLEFAGHARQCAVRFIPLPGPQGTPQQVALLLRDDRPDRERELALREAQGLAEAHFEHNPLAAMAFDAEGRITRWSDRAERLFALRHEQVLGRQFAELGLIEPDGLGKFLSDAVDATSARARNSGRSVQIHEWRRSDGVLLTCEWHLASLQDEQGKVISTLALVQDITERMESERQLQEFARYDSLTRLLNRNALLPTLNSTIETARAQGTAVAVLFIDLDRFKHVNDTLGHFMGDLLITEVATVLRQCVRPEDAVIRMGGDEFMIITRHRQPKAAAHEISARILKSISQPFVIQGHRMSIAASIGIAIYPDHGQAAETLLRSADLAMYRAKETGRNRFEFFSSALAQKHQRQNAIKNGLQKALDNNLLRLHYQPRVSLQQRRIVGAEALLRWSDPELGVVSPKEFIAIAEETGLIHAVGLWVFRAAAAQLADWQMRGIAVEVLSVNFSAHQLLVPDFINDICSVIQEFGSNPHQFEVEITETSMLFDIGIIRNVIGELKQLGMRVAIDDFGTGYSSLSHLQQLDIDTLKIDQSFVRDMLVDEGDLAITRSVIGLGHNLKLNVTAEGVENERQLAALFEAGCDEYQGFYFSPAVAVEDFEILLAAPLRGTPSVARPATDR